MILYSRLLGITGFRLEPRQPRKFDTSLVLMPWYWCPLFSACDLFAGGGKGRWQALLEAREGCLLLGTRSFLSRTFSGQICCRKNCFGGGTGFRSLGFGL